MSDRFIPGVRPPRHGDLTLYRTAFAGYTRILGEAAHSPLVRRPFGSPDQVTLGLKVTYSFEARNPLTSPDGRGRGNHLSPN